MRDLGSNISVEESLHPAARTAAAQGSTVDTRGFDSAAFVTYFGAIADGFFQYVLEESDSSGSGFTTVAATDLLGDPDAGFGGSPEAGANIARKVSYIGSKRYLRVAITQGLSPAPATGALTMGLVILGHPHVKPTSAE